MSWREGAVMSDTRSQNGNMKHGAVQWEGALWLRRKFGGKWMRPYYPICPHD
jgi:hypothetical protein